MKKTRVRFAPSPTGPLHMGGVRTALYNYLYAKKRGGDFILRIEDTDSHRFVPGAEEYIIEALKWCGIVPDEGVDKDGKIVEVASERHPHAPYRQSQRRSIYRKYADQLVEAGWAYYAFDSAESLEAARAAAEAKGETFIYNCESRKALRNSLSLPEDEVKRLLEETDDWTVRFKMPENEVVEMDDLIRGHIEVNTSTLDDKVLWKRADELPTYHLANIVDDHLMEISHVIRGEEWLPSAPLHVLLYRAFGWEDTMPQFAHLPLLLKPDGNGKLSKRDGDRLGFPVFPLEFHNEKDGTVSSGYRESGYLPEAVINFLALLGWHGSGDKELYTMDELIQEFSLDRVSKAGAKFDYEKGKWFNHQYLLQKSDEELAELFMPILETKVESRKTIAEVAKVIGLTKDRVNFVNELWEQVNYFFVAPTEYDEKSLAKRWKEDSPRHMQELIAVLENVSEEDWHKNYETTDDKGNAVTRWHLDDVVMPWIAEHEYGVGIVMNAFRICLVGAARGVHIWAITDVLGKEETLARVHAALRALK